MTDFSAMFYTDGLISFEFIMNIQEIHYFGVYLLPVLYLFLSYNCQRNTSVAA